jgi:predicted PurR-regulated permease PerM
MIRLDKTPRDNNGGWFTRERTLVLLLAGITLGVFYLCYLLVLPFVPALTWAVAIAVIAHPLHEWVLRRFRSRSIVAALVVVILTASVLVPAVFVAQRVTNDAADTAEKLKSGLEGGKWRQLIERNELAATLARWIEREVDIRAQIERFTEDILGGAKKLISGSVYFVTGLLITLFLLFYFFRDKEKIVAALHRAVPLSPRETDRLFRKVQDTIYAIVYGTVLVALVQGALGGIMFWILGLPSPLLWGTAMALLAILPVLGAALIWVPAAIFLLVEGSWEKALILTAWGGIVVAFIDNLLYPVFVKGRLRLHTVPVFISIIGGLVAFGGAGVVLGPVVLAIAVALTDVWRQRMAQGDAVENGADAEAAGREAAPARGRQARTT